MPKFKPGKGRKQKFGMPKIGGKKLTKMSGNKGMGKLIQIINRLQDVSTQTNSPLQLDLPQIAVVGSQSAGKSSVLENSVGRDFLPRGTGIVTRCPLILQLSTAEKEYGEFLHKKGKSYDDFDEIRSEIESETSRRAGENKGISQEPINLQIFSPHVLKLTLIDLPGLTKVPIGDQPEDIEAQTKSLILEYISKENCLILAVTPANIDLANSDALKLAREVDPDGNRTIGVITKLDLMDLGTDALKVLENQVFPLQHGYIGVVNRSQKDIDGNKDIQAALKSEENFFIEHPAYNHIAERCGTRYLQQALNRKLEEHISKSMPSLQCDLQKKMTSYEQELKKHEGLHLTEPSEMRRKILELSKEIEKIEYEEEETLKAIDKTIRNQLGIRCSLYVPHKAFETFARLQISKLKLPITRIIDLVNAELRACVQSCTQKIVYPKFREHLKQAIIKYMKENEEQRKKEILSLVDIEMAYINTSHLDFDDTNDKSAKGEEEEEEPGVDLHKESRDMYRKLMIYMENVKKNMKDMVSKAITHYIIDKLIEFISKDLLFESTDIPSNDHPKLLKLDGMDEAKYNSARKMYEACKNAMEDISDLFESTNGLGQEAENEI